MCIRDRAHNDEDDDHDDHGTHSSDEVNEARQLDSHVHGGASLALVLEGQNLTVELDSPLYNLLGFEHEPETDAQRTTLGSVQKKLVNGGDLLRFNKDANCVPIASSSSVTLFEEPSHDDEHHDDHDDEHAEDSHRDVVLSYNFICQNPAALKTLSVEMLNDFPLMTEVDVIYLGPRTQSSYEVTSSNIEIDLRP